MTESERTPAVSGASTEFESLCSMREWRALSDNAYSTSQVGSWEESTAAFEAALKRACRRAARGEIAGTCASLPLSS